MNQIVQVWFDSALDTMTRVGSLSHDRGHISFVYDKNWLKDPRAFALDPDLSLGAQPYFPRLVNSAFF